ncbi:MAG: DNA mismatch endonuclease Vsr [Myxococcales bacterium]|nr:DNA mismatch endonuclease Vsr [Myxococcales bacterium]
MYSLTFSGRFVGSVTSKETSERMKRVPRADTKPELAVRRLVRDLGFHYRKGRKNLPGKPDISNQSQGWAIFVHGCFWHGHEHCPRFTVPKTDTAKWLRKFAANRERDGRKERQLRRLGFRVLTVWECELDSPATLIERLRLFLDGSLAEMPDGDGAFLESAEKPDYSEGESVVTLVDLFSGCGGLTLGVAEACRALGRRLQVKLAVERDATAFAVYKANFEPELSTEASLVEDWFPGDVGSPPSDEEKANAEKIGPVDILVAGPPCQGHSNLNNHTRGNDPRNGLYERVVRTAEVLRPRCILVEQVPSAKRDAERVVQRSTDALRGLGYDVSEGKVWLVHLGVPQQRERHVLIASSKDVPLLSHAYDLGAVAPMRNLAWAIGDIEDEVGTSLFETASTLSAKNVTRAKWLLTNDAYDLPNDQRPECHRKNPNHKYKSMYGRLRWDEPAQTITTGFGSPGQGRYLHPSRVRTLTPHEAARIQFFPDWFDFSAATTREALARVIGNAVPPKLGYALARYLLGTLEPVELTDERLNVLAAAE